MSHRDLAAEILRRAILDWRKYKGTDESLPYLSLYEYPYSSVQRELEAFFMSELFVSIVVELDIDINAVLASLGYPCGIVSIPSP